MTMSPTAIVDIMIQLKAWWQYAGTQVMWTRFDPSRTALQGQQQQGALGEQAGIELAVKYWHNVYLLGEFAKTRWSVKLVDGGWGPALPVQAL